MLECAALRKSGLGFHAALRNTFRDSREQVLVQTACEKGVQQVRWALGCRGRIWMGVWGAVGVRQGELCGVWVAMLRVDRATT